MKNRSPYSIFAGAVPPVVLALMIMNTGLFALEHAFDLPLVKHFALWPRHTAGKLPDFHLWQLLTYGFLHADFVHLGLNMFGLWVFGRELEQQWGAARFTTYFLVCVVGAGTVQWAVVGAGYSPTIGASGGIFGLLLGFGLMYPNDILSLFPPLQIRVKYMVLIYGVLELWLGVTAPKPIFAHFAHLGGMLFGFLLRWYWRWVPPPRNLA